MDAPRDSAFAMCPEFWMPPSAMVGTPHWLATRDTWYTAAACPLPTAQTCMPYKPEPLPGHFTGQDCLKPASEGSTAIRIAPAPDVCRLLACPEALTCKVRER